MHESGVFVHSIYNYYNNVNLYCNQHPKRDDLIYEYSLPGHLCATFTSLILTKPHPIFGYDARARVCGLRVTIFDLLFGQLPSVGYRLEKSSAQARSLSNASTERGAITRLGAPLDRGLAKALVNPARSIPSRTRRTLRARPLLRISHSHTHHRPARTHHERREL